MCKERIESICLALKNIWANRRLPINILIIFVILLVSLIFLSFVIDEEIVVAAALGLFAFYTADSHWTNNKLNLFDKRFTLYKKILNELDKYMSSSEEHHCAESLQIFKGLDVGLLFGDKVKKSVEQIYVLIERMIQITRENRQTRDDSIAGHIEEAITLDRLTRNAAKQEEIRIKLRELREDFINQIRPYLDFNNIK